MIITLALATLAATVPPGLGVYAEAGYDFGGELPKAPKPTCSVADFGAKPNDKIDDTAAFETALEKGGVITIPAGEFTLSRRLFVKVRGTIILGAGSTKTLLRFTQSLEKLDPSPTTNTGGTPTTQWSWIGGLLTFQGMSRDGKASALSSAKRGATKLKLTQGGEFQAGQEVVISLNGTDDVKLVSFLYANEPGKTAKLKTPKSVELSARIAAVADDEITLTAPLLIDLPEDFSPTIAPAGERDEYGIRGVGFRLTAAPYRGHFQEDGWNPLEFHHVRHGWIDDIFCSGVDSGPFVSGAHVTVRRLVFESGRRASADGTVGHHGISFGGQAHRLEEFEFKTRFQHDITFSQWTNGNVVRAGKGTDLSLDFHKEGPFCNLVTNVSSDAGTHFFACGGGADLGQDAGGWNIFWNLKSRRPIGQPSDEFCPSQTTFVGVDWKPAKGSPFKVQPLRTGDPTDLWLALRAKPVRR